MFSKFILSTLALSLLSNTIYAFDANSKENVVLYWGQNSAGSQQRLSYYCEDDSADILVLSFMSAFPGANNIPTLNFANACETSYGNGLLHCSTIAEDIKTCQNKGKIVLLSMGGASGAYGFSSSNQATEFASTLWDMFGEGNYDNRPFDDAVIDGFDLDIEDNIPEYYSDLVSGLRSQFEKGSKQYYISAAPQCPLPDASLNKALTGSDIDFAFIQFYNNYCSLGSNFNYDSWSSWADSDAYNKNIKLYMGLPGAASAAGSGYVSPDTVKEYAQKISADSHFGGISIWDASQADSNINNGKNFAQNAKAILESVNTGGSSQSTSTTSSSSKSTSTLAPTSSTSESTTSTSSTSTSASFTSTSVISSSTSTDAAETSSTTASSSVSTSSVSIFESTNFSEESTTATSSLSSTEFSTSDSSSVSEVSTTQSDDSEFTSTETTVSSTLLSSYILSSSSVDSSSSVTEIGSKTFTIVEPTTTITSTSSINDVTAGIDQSAVSSTETATENTIKSAATSFEITSYTTGIPMFSTSVVVLTTTEFVAGSSQETVYTSTIYTTIEIETTITTTIDLGTVSPLTSTSSNAESSSYVSEQTTSATDESIPTTTAETKTTSSSVAESTSTASTSIASPTTPAEQSSSVSNEPCAENAWQCGEDGTIQHCNFGKWVSFQCAAGTVCKNYTFDNTDIVGCVFP